MLMCARLPEPAAHQVRRIHSEAQRAAKIIHNLLAFARRHEPEKRYMDVTAVLEWALGLKAYDFSVGRVQVTRRWPQDLPRTMVDEHQLIQVIMNILTNGEQAMLQAHGKEHFTISAKRSADRINISITDDGPGIAADNLHRIFDPFFTTKDVGEGTGLGLSICYGIVRQHSGTMWVESPPGHGATFHIELPILSPEGELGYQPGDFEPNPPPRQRILVVDDEPVISRSLD